MSAAVLSSVLGFLVWAAFLYVAPESDLTRLFSWREQLFAFGAVYAFCCGLSLVLGRNLIHGARSTRAGNLPRIAYFGAVALIVPLAFGVVQSRSGAAIEWTPRMALMLLAAWLSTVAVASVADVLASNPSLERP